MRTAIQQCCVQLKSKITRAQAAREQRQRKKNLTKYIPNVAAALFTVLQAVAARPAEGQAAGTCRNLLQCAPAASMPRLRLGAASQPSLACTAFPSDASI